MSARVTWIGIVVALLAGSVGLHLVLALVATLDPGFAVEPDYEHKAADWDAVQRQASVNRRLGWGAALRTTPGPAPGTVDVALELHDADGAPIPDAAVAFEAFHVARAARVIEGSLTADAAGVYRAALPIRRSGRWEFRVSATRGDDVYTEIIRASVLSLRP